MHSIGVLVLRQMGLRRFAVRSEICTNAGKYGFQTPSDAILIIIKVIAVKLEEVLPNAEDTDRDKFARIILADNTVKRRYQGKTVRLAQFSSEDERIAGHLKYFGISIPEGDSIIKNKPLYLG